MTDSNTPAPQIAAAVTQWRANQVTTHATLPAQPLAADEAAALCLSMVSDLECRVLSADAFRELRNRNAALLDAPKAEIQAALSRQAVVLEAVSMRFMAKAMLGKTQADTAALTKISLSASRSLVAVLAALYAMARDADAETTNEAEALHADA